MEGSVCGLIATSHQFACLGVCQLPIPSAPVTLTLVSGDGTPVNLTCTSLMPSGTCVNVPTMSSPVCPNSVAITVCVALSLCVVSSRRCPEFQISDPNYGNPSSRLVTPERLRQAERTEG